jgi:hypothetical protein
MYSAEARNLLKMMLSNDPNKRKSVSEALEDDWFINVYPWISICME